MLRICFLGTLQVINNGFPIPPFSTQKAASLFGYLVLNQGKALHREFLANLFWPDRPEENARRSLHTALWQIRNSLKAGQVPVEEYLVTSNNTVTWIEQSDDWLDVEVFKNSYNSPDIQVRKNAVQLYQGRLLAHLNDDWCIEECTRLEIYYLEALKSLIENSLATEDFSGAVESARQMIAVDPLNEDANRGMIYALYQLGNRSGVTQHYKTFSSLLKAELGILPSEDTCRLYQQIIDGQIPQVSERAAITQLNSASAQPGLQPDGPETAPVSPVSPNLDLFERGIFASRKQEMQALNEWWSNQPEIVAQVKGGQGSGKTRLMQEFSTALKSQGALIGWGRCMTFSQALPYQVISDVIHSLLACTPNAVREKIPGQVTRNLLSLYPELEDVLDPPLFVLGETAVQMHPFNAFAGLLTYLAQFFPILLVIDDMNWADNSTQQMLEYLIRDLKNGQANGRRAIRILTASISDVDHPGYIVTMNAQLRRDSLLREFALQDLDYEAILHWLTCWCGSVGQTDVLAKHLYRQTGGNPFFIIETMKAVLQSGDLRMTSKGWEGAALDLGLFPVAGSIRALIENRMNGLNPFARQLLLAASLVGFSFSFSALREAFDVSEETLLQALDELFRVHLIQESQQSGCSAYEFTFTHQLVRMAVYNQVDRTHRAIFRHRLHLQVETASLVSKPEYSKSLPSPSLSLS